ncbi:MAG TPA: hypothetical protein VM733_04745 [Thermoanaerobaculia bacterium]|nr:hypothetical protein [Thermoanaerobaculia bacterium]
MLPILALLACRREPPQVAGTPALPPPPRKPAPSPYAGCYSVIPPLAFTDTDRIDELQLVATPQRAVIAPPAVSCPDFCSWEEKDGGVIVGLGTGFVGWGLTLHPTARGLEGMAEFGSDAPVESRPRKVALVRKPCG